MSRVAIIGDLHLGVRSGNEDFHSFQANYIDWFIDKCVELKVDCIVNPGDFFDVRKSMNIRVLDYVKTRFKDKVNASGIEWALTPGNHDIFLKHSNSITSMRLFDDLSPLIKVYEQPTDIMIGNEMFLMLPWLDDTFSQNLDKIINDSKANYCFGHFEFAGFPMYAGSVAPHGLSIEPFKKFKRVWSGHYHTISERQNIQYLGSPYHLTWGDVPDGTNRGFFVFDTATGQQELICNEPWMSLFGVHVYDPTVDENVETLTQQIGNKIIKIVVREKPNEKHFKTFIKVLNQVDMIEYRIIDETVVKTQSVTIKEADLKLNTSVVFERYIDGQDEGMFDKPAVKLLMNDVLARAQETV